MTPASTSTDGAVSSNLQSRLSSLGALLENLVETTSHTPDRPPRQNQLIQVRLGIASALYTLLRIRHSPTAEHSLRVALGCSSWALAINLEESQRDEIEVAALLHDIGKVATPDSILRSARPMSSDEAAAMADCRRLGRFVLSGCCTNESIPRIVDLSSAWFDGSNESFDCLGKDLPVGSRMISIVDAFDSMTTEHIYRKAMSADRAVAELFNFAGTQFDPDLVQQFANLMSSQIICLRDNTMQRWLENLTPEKTNRFWSLGSDTNASRPSPNREPLFYSRMTESMIDGIIFVDQHGSILRWNPGAEELTRISRKSVLHRRWVPSLLGLRTPEGEPVQDAACPVGYAITTGTQSMHRLMFKGRRDRYITVDLQVVPVVTPEGKKCGATIVLRDASPETNLEERVQTLHEKATRDPLTNVANRAEFDLQMIEAIQLHETDGRTFSLIIADLDHFKKVNDTYGHQAGDDVLIAFGALLQRSCRQRDIVARYGGEEFVIICKNCPTASAVDLAEKIRREWGGTPRMELDGEYVTCSFGVTELQPGDTAETVLRRADRALYKAKDGGRNRVVELGVGMDATVKTGEPREPSGISSWWNAITARSLDDSQTLVDCYLATNVPANIAVEKLRGFFSDHEAGILNVTEEKVSIRIRAPLTGSRRTLVAFTIEMNFVDANAPAQDNEQASGPAPTIIRVQISPERGRERRNNEMIGSAKTLIRSLRSYLMAYRYDIYDQQFISDQEADQ